MSLGLSPSLDNSKAGDLDAAPTAFMAWPCKVFNAQRFCRRLQPRPAAYAKASNVGGEAADRDENAYTFDRSAYRINRKLPAENAMTALPVGKPAGAFQSLSDTGFTAQPLLVQRMMQWQVPLLVGAHSVGVHGGLGEAR
jgi:hypothetical protein